MGVTNQGYTCKYCGQQFKHHDQAFQHVQYHCPKRPKSGQ